MPFSSSETGECFALSSYPYQPFIPPETANNAENSALRQFRNERIVDKMRDNNAPMAEQRQRMIKLLDAGETEMEAYGKEIDQHHAAIMTIQNQKRELACHMSRTRSLLTPIRTLPVEVLSQIFRYFVIMEGGNRLGIETVIPAGTLSLVCKHWRDVTLWTWELWSIIRIDIEHKPSLHALNILLSRTVKQGFAGDSQQSTQAQMPLTLTLFSDKNAEEMVEDDPVFTTILSQSFRWRHLTIKGYHDTLWVACLEAISGQLAQLESLELKPDYERIPGNGHPLALFKEAPLLRIANVTSLEHCDLPWPQLLSLSFGIWFDFDSSYWALERLAVVDDLSITFHFDAFIQSHTPDSARLRLDCRKLHIDFSDQDIYPVEDDEQPQFIFSRFRCPLLENLSLTDFSTTSTDNPDCNISFRELGTFLTISQPPLRSLNLERISIECSELKSTLSLMPLLEELTIDDFHSLDHKVLIPDLFLAMMPFRPETDDFFASGPCLLPSLVKASFTMGLYATSFDQLAMADMLQSRWITDSSATEVKSLKHLVLRSKGMAFEGTIVQRMKQLRLAGLKVTVKDTTGWLLS